MDCCFTPLLAGAFGATYSQISTQRRKGREEREGGGEGKSYWQIDFLEQYKSYLEILRIEILR
ncbi:MAG: hypothetical protein LBC52_03570 [Treponema sp.]|jgi:hypothetical protein|nr:hypothetical protein [Treponema sp.]